MQFLESHNIHCFSRSELRWASIKMASLSPLGHSLFGAKSLRLRTSSSLVCSLFHGRINQPPGTLSLVLYIRKQVSLWCSTKAQFCRPSYIVRPPRRIIPHITTQKTPCIQTETLPSPSPLPSRRPRSPLPTLRRRAPPLLNNGSSKCGVHVFRVS